MIFLQKRKSFYLYRLRTTNLNKTFLSMFRKIYLTAFLTLITSFAFAQTGTLKGVITNRATGAPVDFANVVIMLLNFLVLDSFIASEQTMNK